MDHPTVLVVQAGYVLAKMVTLVISVPVANQAITNQETTAIVSLVSYYILPTIYPRND